MYFRNGMKKACQEKGLSTSENPYSYITQYELIQSYVGLPIVTQVTY